MLNFHIADAPCFPQAPSITPLKKLDSYYHRFLLGRLQYPKANRKQWLCIGVLWAMSKWFLLGMNSPVGFRLKRTSQKNNLNFHIDGFLADMSGRSIAAIRHKRSKIQRSWPVLEWVQYEWVKACNGLPRITATLRSGIFQNASSNFEYSPLDVRVCLWSQDLR